MWGARVHQVRRAMTLKRQVCRPGYKRGPIGNRTATNKLIRVKINLHAHCRRRRCHFVPSVGEHSLISRPTTMRVPSFSPHLGSLLLSPHRFSFFSPLPFSFPNSSTVSIPSQAESLETHCSSTPAPRRSPCPTHRLKRFLPVPFLHTFISIFPTK